MATLYPLKNLIPPYTDWSLSTGVTNAVLNPDNANFYSAYAWSGLYVYIPIESNMPYTFSYEPNDYISGDLQFYARFLDSNGTQLGGAYPLHRDRNGVTPSGAVRAKITAEPTTSGINKLLIAPKIQLEKGSTATPITLYRLEDKVASFPKDVVASNMTGSTHKPTNGNVFTVLKDVRMRTAQINVMETGNFNAAVYEWVDGQGITGSPIFTKDLTFNSTGVYTFDFEGTFLKAGKTYWIGRYILSGQAGLMRALGYDAGKLDFVTWKGGADYTGTTVVYPTTYYYFFNMILETTGSKPATTTSENLIKGFSTFKLNNFDLVSMDSEEKATYRAKGSTTSNSFWAFDVDPNTDYTFSLVCPSNIDIAIYNNDATKSIAPYVSGGSVSFNSGSYTAVRLYVRTSIGGDVFTLEKPSFIRGGSQPYKSYFEENKPAAIVPKKNLLKDIDSIDSSPLWLKELSTTVVKTGEKYNGSDVYRVTYNALKNGRVFQYFDTKGFHSAGLWIRFIQYDISLVLTLREINFGTSAGLVSANQNIPDWQYIKFENANIQTDKSYMFALYKSSGATTNDIIVDIAMPQLETGSKATDYEPLKLGNKPSAQLYPTKNFVLPYKDWSMDATANGSYEYTDRQLLINFNSEAMYRGLRMPIDMNIFNLLRGKTITLSASYVNCNNAQVQLRFDGGAGGNVGISLYSTIGAAISSTKAIPADFTSCYLVVQSNVVGAASIDLRELQIEIGDKATPWNKYNLGNR